MKLTAKRPTKWLRNWIKRRTIINGGRTQLVRKRNGNWVQRYKIDIKGYK